MTTGNMTTRAIRSGEKHCPGGARYASEAPQGRNKQSRKGIS